MRVLGMISGTSHDGIDIAVVDFDEEGAELTARIEHTTSVPYSDGLALKEGDHSTNTMLQWFVNEQVEEEASADDVVQKLKLIGDNTSALFLLDNELASRSFAPESGVE